MPDQLRSKRGVILRYVLKMLHNTTTGTYSPGAMSLRVVEHACWMHNLLAMYVYMYVYTYNYHTKSIRTIKVRDTVDQGFCRQPFHPVRTTQSFLSHTLASLPISVWDFLSMQPRLPTTIKRRLHLQVPASNTESDEMFLACMQHQATLVLSTPFPPRKLQPYPPQTSRRYVMQHMWGGKHLRVEICIISRASYYESYHQVSLQSYTLREHTICATSLCTLAKPITRTYLVSITFTRLLLARNPSWFVRTRLRIMTSSSRPWNVSTCAIHMKCVSKFEL